MIVVAVVGLLFGVFSLDRTIEATEENRPRTLCGSHDAYHDTERLFLDGEIDYSPVYLQSRMLLDAQRDSGDSAAPEDHLNRMKILYNESLKMKMDCNPNVRYALRLYLLEAEYWVAQQRR